MRETLRRSDTNSELLLSLVWLLAAFNISSWTTTASYLIGGSGVEAEGLCMSAKPPPPPTPPTPPRQAESQTKQIGIIGLSGIPNALLENRCCPPSNASPFSASSRLVCVLLWGGAGGGVDLNRSGPLTPALILPSLYALADRCLSFSPRSKTQMRVI